MVGAVAAIEAGDAEGFANYVATTGEGEDNPFATGHFYGMTTHARGGLFLREDARAIVDAVPRRAQASARSDHRTSGRPLRAHAPVPPRTDTVPSNPWSSR